MRLKIKINRFAGKPILPEYLYYDALALPDIPLTDLIANQDALIYYDIDTRDMCSQFRSGYFRYMEPIKSNEIFRTGTW